MWSRTLLSRAAAAAKPQLGATRRALSDAAAPAAAAASVNLNFCLPHSALYDNASVHSVILPGLSGEYGITANHVPYVAQLKAGVVQILHDETSPPEKYFVPGGYALTHDNSTTDVICPEAVKLDDLDPSAVTAQYEASKSAYGSAPAGSVEQAEAQIEMEVNRAMGVALGINLS